MAKINSINNATGELTIDPGASGDSFVQFDINTTGEFRIGVDDTDDSFRISQGSALGTNDTFVMSDAGERTMPLQPAFSAAHSAQQLDVTGNGTVATVNFTTEIFDQNNDYDGTNTFTAPITGRYGFSGSVFIADLGAATLGRSFIVTSNRTFNGNFMTPISGSLVGNVVATVTDLDAADTALLKGMATGTGADTADFPVSTADCFFNGALIV